MGGNESTIPVVLLMGPTATGKTDLAIELARELPVEIVSVDSALVYRGLDIGTGKPSPKLLREIPHHLIDIRDPAESYSAGQFVADASGTIRAIHARGRLPLLVGGTMLYFRALTRGIAALPSADAAVRAEIDARAAREGWPRLHAELQTIDPKAAARILPNDGQRIQRALEVFRLAGRPLSELQAQTQPPAADFNFSALAWNIGERQELYRRIAVRFHAMVERGFLDEVRRLWSRGDLQSELPAIRAVGYRQLWRHLDGQCGFEDAIDAAIVATRHLARRQLIWLRGDPGVHWIEATAPGAAMQVRERVATLLRC